MKEKLSKGIDLKNAFQKEGFIVMHMPKMPTAERTKIHHANCENLQKQFMGRYGVNEEKNLSGTNKQQRWFYDSIEEIMRDFPKAALCKLCGDGIRSHLGIK